MMHCHQTDYADGVAQVMTTLCDGVQQAGKSLALHGAGTSVVLVGSRRLCAYLKGLQTEPRTNCETKNAAGVDMARATRRACLVLVIFFSQVPYVCAIAFDLE